MRKVGHVVLAGGMPPAAAIQRLKDGGAKVMCFTPAAVPGQEAGARPAPTRS